MLIFDIQVMSNNFLFNFLKCNNIVESVTSTNAQNANFGTFNYRTFYIVFSADNVKLDYMLGIAAQHLY